MKSNPIQDVSLSWAARGLYAYLSTLPNPIHESVKHLTAISPNGSTSTRSAMHELEARGYLTRKAERAHGCITGTLWTLTEFNQERTDFDGKR